MAKSTKGPGRSKAGPISSRPPEIEVEYTDAQGKRVRKQFKDSYAARRFYGAKEKDGAKPKVKASEPIPLTISLAIKKNKGSDFPLTPHCSGKWQKKIDGRIYYFGRWGKTVSGKMQRLPGDEWWKLAMEEWIEQKDDLLAGRTPRRLAKDGELTLKDLCNRFLSAKKSRIESGEITAPMFADYKEITDLLISQFSGNQRVDDLVASDFESLRSTMAERWGLVRLANGIVRVKSVFKYGYEEGLINSLPRYGQFKKPSASVLRRHKAQNGAKMLEADEIRQLLDVAPVQLKAMILLGVNCGFNNKDCADLPMSAVDLKRGWINFPRPKTGIARRCHLWPETAAALTTVIAERPDSETPNVFLTSQGQKRRGVPGPWLSNGKANPVSVAARKLMTSTGVHRTGIGFATLRHVFRTMADGSLDQPAVNHIMGHADGTMAAVYRERIDDARLVAVAEHVRGWLFGEESETSNPSDTVSSSDFSASQEQGGANNTAQSTTGSELRVFRGEVS